LSLGCLVAPALAQIDVTANFGSLTGITSTSTSFGINANVTDWAIVSTPGNPTFKGEMARIAPQFLRVWGGQYCDAAQYEGCWISNLGKPNETWDAAAIKKTFQGYPTYGPHVIVAIGSYPAYMQDPKTGKLLPAYYAAFANYCAQLVRIINIENPGGLHVDMFEVLNEMEGSYMNSGDGTTLGRIVSLAAIAMKAVDPTIKLAGNAFSYAGYPETDNYLLAVKAEGSPLDFISWHEYCVESPNFSTPSIWANGNKGQPSPLVTLMAGYLQQDLGHLIPMYVDEYSMNGSAWNPPDPRVHTSAETVYDALMLVSYLRAGATGTARWDGSDDLYGMMAWLDENFAYFPSAYLVTALNHDFIGSEVAVTTSNDEEVVPFAVMPKAPSNLIGSLLLIHSVVSKSNTVSLAVSNLPQVPHIAVIKTITDSGESVTAQPYRSNFSLTLPGTSVVEVTFLAEFFQADTGIAGTGARR
jgi:xylan 1,4-beta-xylosidase